VILIYYLTLQKEHLNSYKLDQVEDIHKNKNPLLSLKNKNPLLTHKNKNI